MTPTTLPIRLLLADVDGTLVTPAKALTERAISAVRALHDAGIAFAVVSGRPPRGMSMLVGPLELTTPIAAFNGGLVVDPEMHTLVQHVLPEELVLPIGALLRSFSLDVWIYRGAQWCIQDPKGPHVAKESATVEFAPTIVEDYTGLTDDVIKIVGVSDDTERVTAAGQAAREQFGDHVSAARSQPYYLDVTHPDANKGTVVRWIAQHLGISTEEIATIGDMPNDVLMFAHSGLSIAMGNASPDVQRAARRITTANDDEGFANAVERFVVRPSTALTQARAKELG
ncbi:MAG: Cof-type HAD-IIB family hydrolase [Actinomycetota bacterium]|jgi:Cof subfamily protein (haloacid dehalogenase superfamily)|nr:Cof-type HAD-IIB family hydrolase [Actinomycetota bacterium]MDA8358212.1 Cof-type HAD-IIB family hydrolase [Actinomycetota bacterium]